MATSIQSYTLSIRGMTCASCSSTIENQLRKQPFVHSASVNLLTEQANVQIDTLKSSNSANTTNIDDVVSAIQDIGYESTIVAESNDTSALVYSPLLLPQDNHYAHFAVCCLFSIPAFIISMILPYTDMNKSLMKRLGNTNLSIEALLLWCLATIVLVCFGHSFIISAFKSLKQKKANMNVLISLGALSAYLFAFSESIVNLSTSASMPMNNTMNMNSTYMSSDANNMQNDTMSMGAEMFFETTSTLLCLVLLGRYLEAAAKKSTIASFKHLLDLKPDTAILLETAEDGTKILSETVISPRILQRGDIVKVVCGSKVPADGTIVYGSGQYHDSVTMKQSSYLSKTVGDSVLEGGTVKEGVIHIRVDRIQNETTLSNIIRLLMDAQTHKAPIQVFADKVASYFVPVIMILSFVTFIIWLIIGSVTRIEDKNPFYLAFTFGLSVLVIACPCAIGLAAPTAVMVGTGVGARMGILIKGGDVIEMVPKITTLVCSKTGILTDEPVVTEIIHVTESLISMSDICFYLASAEQASDHSLARAIVNYTRSITSSRSLVVPRQFEAISGKGIRCLVNDTFVYIGNRDWMNELSYTVSKQMQDKMRTHEINGSKTLLFAFDHSIQGVVVLSNSFKPEALSVLNYLRDSGIDVRIITSDSHPTVSSNSELLNSISPTPILSTSISSTKKEFITKLQCQGQFVAFLGNDSSALAQADVGITIGNAALLAAETSSIALLNNDLRDVVTSVHLSKYIYNRIRINFIFVFLYNIIGIPFAAGIFYSAGHIILSPSFASLTMILSIVSVILSSLFLKLYKKPTVITNVNTNLISPMMNANYQKLLGNNAFDFSKQEAEIEMSLA